MDLYCWDYLNQLSFSGIRFIATPDNPVNTIWVEPSNMGYLQQIFMQYTIREVVSNNSGIEMVWDAIII